MGKTQTITKTLENDLTLKDLIMFARNEASNVSGIINFKLFCPLIQDKAVIYSLKDLVRQCVIIGRDITTHYGGYGSGKPIPHEKEVVLIDLIGLQFQRKYNSGRLVLIGDHLEEGPLDELIFKNVVGQTKKTVEEVREDRTGRFIETRDCYFDTFAYEMFVANDLLLVCLALNRMHIPEVNLKFLKYGTGFFAGPYYDILEKHISRGVYRGMKALFESSTNRNIRSFEFPFYKSNPQIMSLCAKYSIDCRFSFDDALKQPHPNLMTATTNCADPHAVTGNEMGYSSVDAAIAQNLKSKANKWSPVLNTKMSEEFIELTFFQTRDNKDITQIINEEPTSTHSGNLNDKLEEQQGIY